MTLILFSFSVVNAGENKFPASEIPVELTRNADFVVRLNETSLELNSLTSYTMRVHMVYTVLQESGRDKAVLAIFYDNDSKISGIRGAMYDAKGQTIKTIRPSDFTDESAVPSGTLYSDDRLKYFEPLGDEYPFTIEYEYEFTAHNQMSYPRWWPVKHHSTSLVSSKLKIRANQTFFPRIRMLNVMQTATFEASEDDSLFVLEINDFSARKSEPFSPGMDRIAPVVYVEPRNISIPGSDPAPPTWNAYGMWVNWLNRERGSLNEQTRMQVNKLISGIDDPKEKAKSLYHFFQETTRYISVQIGIGGYQPADAQSVARNGYGDCKALTNYMKALLEAAGIPSCYTFVKSGTNASPLMTDFPSLQFNHAILCVPFKTDTVWLECTSQNSPFGFLGSFTDNRYVLVMTPEGGVIARTPSYPGEKNKMKRKTSIVVDSLGNAELSCSTMVSGLQYDYFEERINLPPEEQKEHVRKEIRAPSVTLLKVNYTRDKEDKPEAWEILEMKITAYANRSGNRLFIPLNLFSIQQSLPPISGIREQPFVTGRGFTDIDSTTIVLPQGMEPDNIPVTQTAETPFGNFSAQMEYKDRTLLYVRKYFMRGGEYPPESYEGFYSFIQKIAKADKTRIVLRDLQK